MNIKIVSRFPVGVLGFLARICAQVSAPVVYRGNDEELDVTLVADLDGDGKTDVVFYKPQEGLWVINGSREKAVQFGQAGDVPIPADYDGDGKIDFAVYQTTTGSVLILGRKQEFKFDRRGLIPLSGGK